MGNNVDQLDADDARFSTATIDKGALGEVQAIAVDYGGVGERRLVREGDGLPVRVQEAALPDGAATEDAQTATTTAVAAVTTSLGTDGTTPPGLPGGATGVRGWLRAILAQLTAGIGITGSVEVTNDAGPPLAVSAAALPLPSGAATGTNQDTTNSRLNTLIQQTDAVEASLTAIDTDLGALDSAPAPADGSGNYSLNGAAKRGLLNWAALLARIPLLRSDSAVAGDSGSVVRPLTTEPWIPDLSLVRANGTTVLSPDFVVSGAAGTGQTMSQGNPQVPVGLQFFSGTTANAQTLVRSVRTFRGSINARAQRSHANVAGLYQTMALADLIGEACPYTILSSAAVQVTYPAGHGFTSANIGQWTFLGALSGPGVPGRWSITNVVGNTVTYAVTAWPVSGSGTCTVYGWNALVWEHRVTGQSRALLQQNGVSEGWFPAANGDLQLGVLSITPMASRVLCHANVNAINGGDGGATTRASWPGAGIRPSVPLHYWLGITNEAAPPASSATWLTKFICVEAYAMLRAGTPITDYGSGDLRTIVRVNTGSLTLEAGNSRIGAVSPQTWLQDLRRTPLGADEVYTSPAFDLSNGVGFNLNAHQNVMTGEGRAFYAGDRAATLLVEVSQDAAVGSWFAVQAPVTATATSGGNFSAFLSWKPATKFARIIVANGPSAMSRCLISSNILSLG